MRYTGPLALVILGVVVMAATGPTIGNPISFSTGFEYSAQPTNLTAIPAVGYVDLAWDVPVDDGGHIISSYLVYRNDGGHPYPDRAVLLATVNATIFSYRDGSAVNDAEYTYYVVTRASDGATSPFSNWVTVTVGATTPSAPNYLRAVPMEGSVELSWLSPDRYGGVQITAYRVYRASAEDGWKIVQHVDPNSFGGMSVIDSGLTNGLNYTYQVKAVNAFGEGTEAAANATPNYAPSHISFSPEYFSGDFSDSAKQLSFDISWYAASNLSTITHYTVYISKYGPSLQEEMDVGLNTSFTLNGTVSELAYASIRVAAAHTDGSESFSEQAIIPVYMPVDGPIDPGWGTIILLLVLPIMAVVAAIVLLVRRTRRRST